MKHLILYGFLFFAVGVFAQEKDKFLPKGNTEFAEKKYVDAEADYRISQSKTPKFAVSSYNLGNSIYRQNVASEAKYPYLKAIESAKTRPQKHKAFHNLGNVFMKEKKYTEAVEAYKNALRNNPDDEQTRYNFALAKKMLKDNPPPPPKKDDKKKDDKKDKKDDKKDQDKKDQDKKDQDKKDDKKDGDKDKKDDKPKDDKGQGQPKPQPGDIPKERLQNLLDAVNNEEKKVQDKVNAKKVKGRPVKTEKDW
ncbi:MAG TPA: tetratricopeptide repeat protein [Flavobacterium sp.]|nr:tetratricopeptide repeat protein [Flavobacterium sp.]